MITNFSARKYRLLIKALAGGVLVAFFALLTSAPGPLWPAAVESVFATCDNGDSNETDTNPGGACPVSEEDGSVTGNIVRQYSGIACDVADEDADWYRFFLDDDDSIVITLSSNDSGASPDFQIYSQIGPEILLREVSGGGNSVTTAFDFTSSRNFYVRVTDDGCSGDSAVEDKFEYRLSFDYYFQEDEVQDDDEDDDTDSSETAAPTVTLVPTPDLGGPADISEPNNIWAQAFRITPGNRVDLNFNSGTYGVEDIDYFVMNVSAGTEYLCETDDLGLATDTILAIYGPEPNDLSQIAVNDDIDPTIGQFNSRIQWESVYEGQVWIIVRQKGPVNLPGRASYDLSCEVDLGLSSFDTVPFSGPNNSNVIVPDASDISGGGSREAISLRLLRAPETVLLEVEDNPVTTIIDVVVGYDGNANGFVDPTEGVSGVSVRVVDPRTNTPLTQGLTNEQGNIRVVQSTDESAEIQVLVPYLSLGREFRAGNDGDWQVIIPSAVLPPVIP